VEAISHRTAVCFVGISIILTSGAQLLFRYVMQHLQIVEILSYREWGELIEALSTMDLGMLTLGIVLYASSMLFWIFALSRLEVSLAYPLLSVSYVIVYFGAVYLPALEESASLIKLLGTVVMVIGVVILSLGNTDDRGTRTSRFVT
jgi:undecaprenyl phosphate-alpha-L-ara4N flippase subunit ArnF